MARERELFPGGRSVAEMLLLTLRCWTTGLNGRAGCVGFRPAHAGSGRECSRLQNAPTPAG